MKGLESQLHEITCENAALVSCADMRKSELDSALISVAAVQHDSQELQSQLTKQSVDLDVLQKSLDETMVAKDKALQVLLAVPACFAFSFQILIKLHEALHMCVCGATLLAGNSALCNLSNDVALSRLHASPSSFLLYKPLLYAKPSLKQFGGKVVANHLHKACLQNIALSGTANSHHVAPKSSATSI